MAYRKANSPFPQSSDPFSDQGCTLNDILNYKLYLSITYYYINYIYQQSKRDDTNHNEPKPVEVDGIDWIHS